MKEEKVNDLTYNLRFQDVCLNPEEGKIDGRKNGWKEGRKERRKDRNGEEGKREAEDPDLW
jgi:hypothetical protein